MVTMFRNGFSDSGMSPEGTKTSLEEEGEKMSSSAIVVEIAADIDGEKLRRAVLICYRRLMRLPERSFVCILNFKLLQVLTILTFWF